MPTFDPTRFINANTRSTIATEEVYVPQHNFHTFGLPERLVATVTSLGLITPSPIQDQIIPHILEGRDVIGLAETGTGKTAAFLLPLIARTLIDHKRQVLILAPTRELATQIEKDLQRLTNGYRIFSALCVGGTAIMPQVRALKHHNQFVIGTPGRIIDLMDRGNFDPTHCSTVVLDEADRMLDMGFIHDMKKIMSRTQENRETLLFSATMSPATEALTKQFMRGPVTVSVKKKDVTGSVLQDVVRYGAEEKYDTLVTLLRDPAFGRVIVFGAMKHGVEKLATQLRTSGIRAESIHGNKSHGQRQRALANFRGGQAQVLVATDVAARGIHVENVTHVINYDLPTSFEDYVHRIGRTGRADKTGKALTFVPA